MPIIAARPVVMQGGKKCIHVAAAVVRNAEGDILLAHRPEGKHQGGLWEFPGGKVEAGETAADALCRELEEEVGLRVRSCRPLIQVPHHYPDKSVLLDVFLVDGFEGEAWGREGQPVRWVTRSELEQHEFPAANRPILSACLLPEALLITGAFSTDKECLLKVETALKQGVGAVMLRTDKQGERLPLLQSLQSLCQGYGANLILNGTLAEAQRCGVGALHLNSRRLTELTDRAQFKGRWLSASCHNAGELAMAVSKGVDFVMLSPVQVTTSHPETGPMGWQGFADLVADCPIPVFALGGMDEACLERAWVSGAQGIASISAWWG